MVIPESELIINGDGSIFHLHLKPGQLADKVILVGDPARVDDVASRFDSVECNVSNREFHTMTGLYKGKRVSVVSHGIGTDNIDIVLNELDALMNIDFKTRTINPVFQQLTLVRIGTSGGLQPYVPIGTYVAAEKSIGFDGVIYFYADNEKVRDCPFEKALQEQLKWKLENVHPYVVSADVSLVEQITGNDIIRGVTIAANGFYGPRHLLPRRRCRTYVKDSLIIGTFDYIFGGGDALFEDCEIRNIDQGIAVAPSGEADWDGFAFRHCRFSTMYPDRDESFLMRPWRKDGKASFVDCTFDDKFMPSEYNPKWPDDDKSAFMLKGKVLPDGREVGEWISLDNLSENEKFFEDSV